LVEDNLEYATSAKKYLHSRGYDTVLAIDYSEANKELMRQNFEGVITDCFFPKTTGSGNIDLGIKTVERMIESDPTEKEVRERLEVLGSYVDLEDLEMRNHARFLIRASLNPEEKLNDYTEFLKSIERISLVIGKKEATKIVKSILGLISNGLSYKPNLSGLSGIDYYGDLINAMKESEANQPLGILIAERCEELGLPSILNASTSDGDKFTKLVDKYILKKGWIFVVSSLYYQESYYNPILSKNGLLFWQRALSELERKIMVNKIAVN
jgi:CheY-like chemotaxis protein